MSSAAALADFDARLARQLKEEAMKAMGFGAGDDDDDYDEEEGEPTSVDQWRVYQPTKEQEWISMGGGDTEPDPFDDIDTTLTDPPPALPPVLKRSHGVYNLADQHNSASSFDDDDVDINTIDFNHSSVVGWIRQLDVAIKHIDRVVASIRAHM